MTSLAERWAPLLDGLPALDGLGDALAERYREPQRAYHGVEHIGALARLFVEVDGGPGWREPVVVKLAFLFHDAIYDPGSADNEARSAALARAWLGPTSIDEQRVAAMIEVTKTHASAQTEGDPDLGHFLDADMAILGAPAARYDRYASQVRDEFSAIPEALYLIGRTAFLRAQLDRAALFHTPWFRQRYGAVARDNIARELATLAHAN